MVIATPLGYIASLRQSIVLVPARRWQMGAAILLVTRGAILAINVGAIVHLQCVWPRRRQHLVLNLMHHIFRSVRRLKTAELSQKIIVAADGSMSIAADATAASAIFSADVTVIY